MAGKPRKKKPGRKNPDALVSSKINVKQGVHDTIVAFQKREGKLTAADAYRDIIHAGLVAKGLIDSPAACA